jgi:HK97 family phage prohead protease
VPYRLAEQGGKYCVIKDDGSDDVVKCHATRKEALAHMAALYRAMADEEKKGVSLERKVFDFRADAVVEDVTVNGVPGWTFEGYFSVWDVVDGEGDATRRGAFKRTFAAGLPIVKYEHGPTVGTVLDAREDEHGPWVKGFVPLDPSTDFIHKLMKIGAVAKMSYGWRPYPGGVHVRSDGVRELTDIQLFEVSPVAIPMLDATSITSVKAGEPVKAGANGLPDAPLDVQLTAAGWALKAAVAEAEAYLDRRTAEGRDVSVKCSWALGELAMDSGEAMLAILSAETKAGQAVAGARKRFVADMMRALRSFIDSLPEAERSQVEAMLTDGDDGDKKGTQADLRIGLGPESVQVDADELEMALIAAEFPGLLGG